MSVRIRFILPREGEPGVSGWVARHHRVVAAGLLLLAALNFRSAYALFPDHPIMGAGNGITGIALVVIVILAW